MQMNLALYLLVYFLFQPGHIYIVVLKEPLNFIIIT